MAETRTQNARDWSALSARLQSTPEASRKLLVHIVELAYGESRAGRQPDTAYLPELHESCGLDVEAMYETLRPLQRAGLIALENKYPFEDIRLTAAGAAQEKLWPVLFGCCESRKIPLRDVIVDLGFDRLS